MNIEEMWDSFSTDWNDMWIHVDLAPRRRIFEEIWDPLRNKIGFGLSHHIEHQLEENS